MIGFQIDVSLVVLERFWYSKLEITIIIVLESHDFLTISTNRSVLKNTISYAEYHMHENCTQITNSNSSYNL